MDDQNVDDLEGFRNSLHQVLSTVDKLEKQVIEVEQFYRSTGNVQVNNSKGGSAVKEKGREKNLIGTKKPLQDASCTETAAAKRMQELIRQFSTILRQITRHKWACPFMDPVDVKGLGLHDYYEVIDKPMDFNTIKSKMDAKDGTGYKNVREIYADVRLIFKNAMKYNDDEKHDVHVMAKTLLEKFEEKWLQLLPKVVDEEKRQLEEESQAQLDTLLAQATTYENMARDLSSELSEVDIHLKNLKETVIQKFRKMSTLDKKILGAALTKLSPENLTKALEIVAENNPSFKFASEEVDLDIDAQSDYTLWKLRVFVKDALEVQGTSAGDRNDNTDDKTNNSKRRRQICDSIAKTNAKRTRKLSTL
ncbi:PREDICTED: transcription factor GTE1-like [Lupinus angustifolius]|nr:PREDICTED: transcription factor GTE1-like [Lupinus angustifolius]